MSAHDPMASQIFGSGQSRQRGRKLHMPRDTPGRHASGDVTGMQILYDFLSMWRAKANSITFVVMGAVAETLPRFKLSPLVVHAIAIG